jgi:hydrogenase nickel incorporation protein HypA/HybF
MHEMALALEVVDIVTLRAAGARVRRVVVEVGALSAVQPDALTFSFELASDGTSAAGARLEIVEKLAQGRCRACNTESQYRDLLARCACGAAELDWLSGDELKVREMELA